MRADSLRLLEPRVRRRPLVLAVLCVSLLLVSLDNTILNVALPDISRDLNASSGELQWIVDTYIVVLAGALLVVGSVGDHLGRKRVFLAGLFVFGAASAICAFSGTPTHLAAARAVLGLGAAGIMPTTLALLTSVYPRADERARAIGLWSGTTGLGVAIGPVVGGWLLAHYWWGSVFLVNVPIAALGLLAAALVVPESRDPKSPAPDFPGAGLSILGMGALLWGIIEAPTRTWGSPVVLGALSAGAAALGLLAIVERRSTHPMLSVAVFSSRRFSAAMGAMAVVMFALFGALFVLTQYLQFSLGYSALATGLRIAPIAVVLLVAAPLSSLAVKAVGTTPVVVVGMALIAGGLALLSRTTVAGGYGDALPALMLVGLGAGLSFAPCTDSVMGALPPARTGVGAATNGAAIQTGGALGVAVLGSLLSTRYVHRLAPVLAGHAMPRSVYEAITGSLGGALEVAARTSGALGTELAAFARGAFVSGMDLAVGVGALVALAGALFALGALPRRPAAVEAAPPTRHRVAPGRPAPPRPGAPRQRRGA